MGILTHLDGLAALETGGLAAERDLRDENEAAKVSESRYRPIGGVETARVDAPGASPGPIGSG